MTTEAAPNASTHQPESSLGQGERQEEERPVGACSRSFLTSFGKLALAGSGIGLSLAAYSYFLEPLNIQLERFTVRLGNAHGRIPPEGLRILHLSDTHFQGRDWREHAKIARIQRLVSHLDFDLIVHTGDFLHYDSGLDNVAKFLDILPRPRFGSFAVLGNHDYTRYAMGEAVLNMWRTYQQETRRRANGRLVSPFGMPKHLIDFGRYVRNTPVEGRRTGSNDIDRLTAVLTDRGVQVLHNRSIHLCHCPDRERELDLYICGVDDVGEGRPYIHHALDDVPTDAPTILLSHNPDIIQSPRIGQVDLVLSGHTHGGQIVLPFWGPAHTQVEFIARENVSGFFSHAGAQVYITRGLGEGIPFRFGARPQLALITVTA